MNDQFLFSKEADKLLECFDPLGAYLSITLTWDHLMTFSEFKLMTFGLYHSKGMINLLYCRLKQEWFPNGLKIRNIEYFPINVKNKKNYTSMKL